MLLDGRPTSLGEQRAQLAEMVVRVGGQNLRERGQSGTAGQRVAVERPLLGGAPADRLHHRGLPAERADRGPAAERLGEAGQVRLHSEPFDRAAFGDGRSGLHLVEDEHHAVAGAQLADGFEVAGLRQDQAHVHHHRLHDECPDLLASFRQHVLQGRSVVERHDQGVHGHHGRDPP